jgi:NAD(P)-dependent dehydrogenase (short-subunit alcohol dehydrogenase family)
LQEGDAAAAREPAGIDHQYLVDRRPDRRCDTMPGYNASKAAVWMLSKSVALHCAAMGWDMRSNSVHPTFIDTPILDGI